MLFDSHCHLTDERLIGEVEAVVGRAREAGVGRMVTVGADPEDMDAAVALAAQFDGVWASVGVHPHVADRATAGIFDRIVELAGRAEVVALGGTRLLLWQRPRGASGERSLRHLELGAGLDHRSWSTPARRTRLPSSAREAGKAVQGVLHCFTGGWDLLRRRWTWAQLRVLLGVVTFKNFDAEDMVTRFRPTGS